MTPGLGSTDRISFRFQHFPIWGVLFLLQKNVCKIVCIRLRNIGYNHLRGRVNPDNTELCKAWCLPWEERAP